MDITIDVTPPQPIEIDVLPGYGTSQPATWDTLQGKPSTFPPSSSTTQNVGFRKVQLYDAVYAGYRDLEASDGDLIWNGEAVATVPYVDAIDAVNDAALSSLSASVAATYEPRIAAGTIAQYWRGDKNWQTLDGAAVGFNLFPSDRASKLRFIGGTVRPTRTGTSVAWAMISDSQHAPIGVSSVSAVNNTLTINFDQTYAKAITCGIWADEFLSKFGITAGASLGLSSMAINLYASYNRQAVFTHDGTSWAVSGFSSGFINGALSVASSITTVNIVDPGSGASSNIYNHCPMVYAGTNNRVLRLVNSGIGANQCKFALIDPTTGTVTAPASGDVVVCYSVNPNYLLNVASAGNTTLEQDIFDTAPTSNLWFFAIMETA